jgi:hypothetical protein
LAGVGLCWSLWSINSTCPIFAVDVCDPGLEIRKQEAGLRVLTEFIEEKAKENLGVQHFVTFPIQTNTDDSA